MAGTTTVPGAGASVAPESPYVQPTFNYALRIWWAFFWPLNVVAGILAFGVMTIVYALYRNVLIPAVMVEWARIVAPFAITYGFAFFVMYYLLGKNFRHFRMALVSAGNYDQPQPVPRTIGRVGRVWFGYSWRALVYGLIATFVTSFPLGTLAGAFERVPFVALALRFIFQIAIAAAVGLYVFYNNILDEQFGDARVCLLKRDVAPDLPQANAAAPAPIA